MKFVIYNGQNKFTINNVSIPDIQKIVPSVLQENPPTKDVDSNNMNPFDLYNFRITSTRGFMMDEDEFEIPNAELEKEIEEGIHWSHETIH